MARRLGLYSTCSSYGAAAVMQVIIFNINSSLFDVDIMLFVESFAKALILPY